MKQRDRQEKPSLGDINTENVLLRTNLVSNFVVGEIKSLHRFVQLQAFGDGRDIVISETTIFKF